MDSNLVSHVLQYAGILIEAALVLYMVWTSQWKGQGGIPLYLTSLLCAQLTRAYILHVFGATGTDYFYVYWSTDLPLVVSAFLLVCFLFRRACRNEEKMWNFVRLLLLFVFVLVVGVAGLTFSRNYNNLFTDFVVEFNQDLYFACLVLNTLLYLLLQYIESIDEQLGLLVCGVGIMFAGPAASLALYHITGGEPFAESLTTSIIPLCSFGMLLVWAYAIVLGKGKETAVARRENTVLAGG
jgi:hypothetical protein